MQRTKYNIQASSFHPIHIQWETKAKISVKGLRHLLTVQKSRPGQACPPFPSDLFLNSIAKPVQLLLKSTESEYFVKICLFLIRNNV